MIKAAMGGGGRGMRVVREAGGSGETSRGSARRGALRRSATPRLPREISARARHIEVQILGDHHGNLVHLWERDCSVQRRHQKVVEVAPAANLDPQNPARAVRSGGATGASGATIATPARWNSCVDVETGELVFHRGESAHSGGAYRHRSGDRHRHGPLADSDRARTQTRTTRRSPCRRATRSPLYGYALQCRVTTEDPENNFVPDYGKLTTYRSPAGFGIRLDGGTGVRRRGDRAVLRFAAGEDHGVGHHDCPQACQRMDRALREFRIRGVKTNIPFLENVVHHPRFQAGGVTTRISRRDARAVPHSAPGATARRGCSPTSAT